MAALRSELCTTLPQRFSRDFTHLIVANVDAAVLIALGAPAVEALAELRNHAHAPLLDRRLCGVFREAKAGVEMCASVL